MLLNFEDLSSVKKVVEVEIPAALISSTEKRVTSEFANQANLPGFRPGKVPVNVVRSRFAKEIQEEVMNRLLPQTFREVVAERGLEPVGDPHLEHVDPYPSLEGSAVKYKAQFEVKPHVELSEYRGLEVDDKPIEMNESEIDTMIERLRDQASSYRLETERGLADGDYAVIDVASSGQGIDGKTDSGHVRIGEDTPLPELHEGLRGKRGGDQISFEKTYGEDASNEDYRGKTIRHDVTLKEVRVQEKPEINDDFARSVGNWESVAQMREVIGGDLRRHKEAEVARAKRNQIGDRLLETHDFEVPDSLVEEELGKSLQNYARFLASQGVDLEKAELDWSKLGADFRPEAVKRVKRGLILEAIARKEGVEISDVEVDAEIRRAAREQDRDFAEVKHHLKNDGGYEALRRSLSQEKALELVLREAKTRS